MTVDPIEMLEGEHVLILRVLDALENFAKGGAAQPDPAGLPALDRATLRDFVRFNQEYADRMHHAVEEDVLFAAMVENGFPRDAGPIAVMLHEHERGRACVRELAACAEGEGAADGDRVVRAAREYVDLLRQHIEKENQVLYPMAQSRLPEAVMARVAEASASFRRSQQESGARAQLEALAERLAAAYP